MAKPSGHELSSWNCVQLFTKVKDGSFKKEKIRLLSFRHVHVQLKCHTVQINHFKEALHI